MIFVKRFRTLAIFICILFCGYSHAANWNEINTPDGFYCYDILSFSHQNIYVVGYNGSILHFNGNDWEKMSTPTRMPIWSIWGADPEHIYAVGGNGTILFYNGLEWALMDSGTRQWLYDIWGADSENIYAVGAGIILKFDGNQWTHMMIGDDRKTFFTIWGNNDHDIYAAGDFGKIYHYNGLGWTEIKGGLANQIWGIWTYGVHIFAAGNLKDNQTFVYHFDGVQWKNKELSVKTHLWGIWGSSENDVYLVGDSGTIVNFDGQNWQTQTVNENARLRSVWGNQGTAYVLAENGSIYKKEAAFHIQLGHVSGHAGESLRIPISLTNTTMIQMEGIDITIDYDPNIISIQDAVLSDGILSDKQYTLEAELSKPGRAVLVIGAIKDCSVASGVMAYLVCRVLDDIGRTGDFKENQWNTPQAVFVSKAEINENPASVHNGSVTVMNFPPIISDISDLLVSEDQGPFDIPFTIHDTESSVDTLTITVDHNGPSDFFKEPLVVTGLYAHRSIHMIPTADVNGQTEIQISVFDGINTTKETVLLTIQPVNDPPVFIKGDNITIQEDDDRQVVLNWATGITSGPQNEKGQSLSFIIETLNGSLFEETPQILPNGTLIFKSQPNAFGKAEIEIVLEDNGAQNNRSIKQTFVIDILPVNDPPAFIPGENITLLEDAGFQTITGWAKSIVAGNAFETSQGIIFKIQTDNDTLFSPQYLPEINENGDLTFMSAPDSFGSACVSATIEDSGGIEHGGVSTSGPHLFTITVLPVNDPPSFLPGTDISIYKNAGLQSFENWATKIQAGPENESSQAFHFNVTTNSAQLFDILPNISLDGTLTFTPKSDATGNAQVTAYLIDNIENEKSQISAVERFNINISDFPTVSGSIRYYSNNLPVGNVNLILEGETQYQTQTDDFGNYVFADVKPGNYILTPKKGDDLSGLSGTDASSIFRHASETHSLSCYEMIAADVTQSGHIGGTDASRVARYRAGLTKCLNNNCLEWVFTPEDSFARSSLNAPSIAMNGCQKW
ncbi:secreted protein containing Cellulosome anchoring protein, cohesin region domain protein, partial [Candidatus Magnetomorum sp. HK-1]